MERLIQHGSIAEDIRRVFTMDGFANYADLPCDLDVDVTPRL